MPDDATLMSTYRAKGTVTSWRQSRLLSENVLFVHDNSVEIYKDWYVSNVH